MWKCLLILCIMLFLNWHRYGMGSLAFLIVFAFPGVSINYNLQLSPNLILTSFDWKVGTSWLNYMLPASRSKDKPSPNIFFQITFHCEMISVDKWFRLSSSKCWSQLTTNFSYPHPNVHLVWLILSNSQPGLDNYNDFNNNYKVNRCLAR